MSGRPRRPPRRLPDPASTGNRLTPGQRWRFRRNLVIYLVHRQGASQRLLADVFDLPCSRICQICREMRERYGKDLPS